MNLADLKLYGYGRRCTSPASRYANLMHSRIRRRMDRMDPDAKKMYWLVLVHVEYDWATDRVRAAVRYKGELVFMFNDPEDEDEMQACCMALVMLNDN